MVLLPHRRFVILLLAVERSAVIHHCDGFSPLPPLPYHVARGTKIEKPNSSTATAANSNHAPARSPAPRSSRKSTVIASDRRKLNNVRMHRHDRRSFSLSVFFATFGAAADTATLLRPAPSFASDEIIPGQPLSAIKEEEKKERRRIMRLSSGLQFSDERVGSGRFVELPPKGNDDDDDDGEGEAQETIKRGGDDAESSSVVLMHLRATFRDGSVLFDSRYDGGGGGGGGRPILFRLGSVSEEVYFLEQQQSALKRGIVTLAVQDAIVARGGSRGKRDDDEDRALPMRLGGIRRVVAPSALAYGRGGASRYDAFRLGLRRAVPRDETLLYEIELLRCSFADVPRQRPQTSAATGDDGVRGDQQELTPPRALACCPEEQFPCKISTSPL